MATAVHPAKRVSVPPSWVKNPGNSVTQEIPLVNPGKDSRQNGELSPPTVSAPSLRPPQQHSPARSEGFRVRQSIPTLPNDPRNRTQEIPLNNPAASPAVPAPRPINGTPSSQQSPSRISPPRSASRPFSVGVSPVKAGTSPLRVPNRYETQEIPLNARPESRARPQSATIRNSQEMQRLSQDLRQSPPPETKRPWTVAPQPSVRIPVEQIPLNFASIHPDAGREPGSAGGMSTHNADWLQHERADEAKNREPEKAVRSSWDIAGRLRQGFEYMGETPLTEKEASRVYLLRPVPPHGPDKRDRVAQMLGKEYGVPPSVIREIWDTKCLPGSGAPLPLSSWQTEGLPEWMQYQPPAEEDVGPLWGETQRVYRTSGPLTQPSEDALARNRPVHALPSHRLLTRADGKTNSELSPRIADPPAGVLDVLVVEACNLPVPHKFESLLNTSSIVPYVQVQVVHETSDGNAVRDWLKTPSMDKSMLKHWRRDPIDPVFNHTLRFPGIIDGGNDEKREVVLSVHDASGSGSGFLGQWRVPIKMLYDGAFGVEGWVDLNDEHNYKPVEGFNRGKRCAVLVRAICRPLPTSVLDMRKAAREREAAIKADLLFRKEAERIRMLEEKQRREQEAEEERMRQEQHRRIQEAMETAKRRQDEEAMERQLELQAEAERLQTQERLLALEAEQNAARDRLAAEEARARERQLREQREREQAEFELRVEEEKERLAREVQNQTYEELMQKRETLLQIHHENELLEKEIQQAAERAEQERLRRLEEQRLAVIAEASEAASKPAQVPVSEKATPAAGPGLAMVPNNSLHDPNAAVSRAEPDEEVDPEEVWKDPAKMLRLAGVEPWMERGDIEWVKSRPQGAALSCDFRIELVPGAVGALQGIAAEGYEIVLVGVAKPWLAKIVAEALRTVNVVGPKGIVKEKDLVFCNSSADKLRIARALGKVVAAVDDDWNVLKSYPSLGLGPGLVLFNPHREELSSFNEDEKVWRTYKMGLSDATRALAIAQREAVVLETSKDTSPMLFEQHARALMDLHEKEVTVIPELTHLLNKEPRNVLAIHADTLPPLHTFDGLQGRSAARAVEPWLRVAEALDVANTEQMLAVLRDVRNPEKGEALARKLNDGTALSAPASRVSFAGAPTGKQPQLPPFYPLQSGAWHYPLEREAAELLPPSVKDSVMQRLFDWRASLEDYRLGYGIGIDFAVAEDMLIVNKLLPCGPAMRTGLIEEGMRLAFIDGDMVANAGLDFARRVLASRIIECEESRRGQCAKRLETFRHMPREVAANFAAEPADLAECGFQLSAGKQTDAVLKCQYCSTEINFLPAGINMWELHEMQSPFCPLMRAAGGHQAPPETDALPRDSCLSMGFILGFVSPDVAMDMNLTKDEFERKTQYVWVCPEPANDKLSPKDLGRVFIDLSRVVMRLRYYETKELVEREPFRDSRLDQSVRVPLTALAHMKDIDEIVDDEGRTVYVDHENKTTSLVPPRPFSSEILPSGWSERRDGDGRMYYANDSQAKSQWELPTG